MDLEDRLEIKEIIEEVFDTRFADKFEDYTKNIDKLNQMINEFKGLVAIVRDESVQVKKQNKKIKKQLKKLIEIISD